MEEKQKIDGSATGRDFIERYTPHACCLGSVLGALGMGFVVYLICTLIRSMFMSTTSVFLIVYGVGVVVNAIGAASIWDDLMEEGRLVKIRMAVVVFFVAASVATWVYMILYLLTSVVKTAFKKRKDNEEDND